MIWLQKNFLVQSACATSALVMFSTVPAFAGSELSPELRQIITEAGMVPWSGRPVPLDETLRRGLSGEKVRLRQFVTGDKPLLVYMYAYW